jgi:hypothetical protein
MIGGEVIVMKPWMEKIKTNPLILTVGGILIALAIMVLIVYGIHSHLERTKLAYEIKNLTQNHSILLSQKQNLETEKQRLIDQLAETMSENNKKIETATLELAKIKESYMYATVPSERTLAYLSENGYATPIALLDTLKDFSNAIPFEGVLGGTMQFWPSESRLLNETWVLGYFEDGHIAGYALLEYTFEANTVKWRIIEAVLQ